MALHEIITDKVTMVEVIQQLRAIKTFPTTVHLYDRWFAVDTEYELRCLIIGLEIGMFLTEERFEQEAKSA